MLRFTSSERDQPILSYNSHQYTKKREREKVNNDIDENLELLLKDHTDAIITDMELAIKCGRALKTKLVK